MAAKPLRNVPARQASEDLPARSKQRIAFRLPTLLKERLLAQVAKDRYSERRVSLWVREALEMMLKEDPTLQFVGQGDQLDGDCDEFLAVAFSPATVLLVHDATLDMRERDLMVDGPRSRLLRSAIRFRLDHPSLSYGEPSLSVSGS